MTEFDRSDREEWYRRGYVRGAWDLTEPLFFIFPRTLAKLRING